MGNWRCMGRGRMCEFLWRTSVWLDRVEVGTMKEDGVQRIWLIMAALKTYTAILSAHVLIMYHVAAFPLVPVTGEWDMSSLPWRSFQPSDPCVHSFWHSQLSLLCATFGWHQQKSDIFWNFPELSRQSVFTKYGFKMWKKSNFLYCSSLWNAYI